MTEPTSSPESTQPDAATRIAELEGQVALLKDTVLRSNADQQNQQRRHHREGIGFAPVVYQDGARLGEATKLDMVANDRRPDIVF